MKLHLAILYVLVLGMLSVLAYRHFRQEKLVYVDNAQLFAGFNMKAELEKKYQVIENQKKATLDSLLARIKAGPASAMSAADLNMLKEEFLYKKNQYEKENAELMTQYNAQIWTRLNEYTKDFGKAHHYQFIFGTSGQGSLMFAQEDANITKDLMDYSNERYNGK